jgi:hypothetical protein
MAITFVERESEKQKAQLVALTQKNKDGVQVIVGSDYGLINVDVNHARMHEGRAFFAWYARMDANKLANAASIDIIMAAAPGITPHITVGYICGGDCEFYMYEGTTTTGGTSFTPINRNRTSSTASQTAMVTNPTINTLGTLIDEQAAPSGGGPKSGGAASAGLEYVLASLTNYHFRLTNVSGQSKMAVLTLEWYE